MGRELPRHLREGIHKVESDIDEQDRHDDELECDLEGQRLAVIERFGERIEDGLDDFDAFVDLAPEPAQAQPAAEPAVEADGPPVGQVAVGVRERTFDQR